MKPQRRPTFVVVLFLIAAPVWCRCLLADDAKPWLFPDIRLRAPVTVKAGIYPRKDVPRAMEREFHLAPQDGGHDRQI